MYTSYEYMYRHTEQERAVFNVYQSLYICINIYIYIHKDILHTYIYIYMYNMYTYTYILLTYIYIYKAYGGGESGVQCLSMPSR
jgi:hypothetical protein